MIIVLSLVILTFATIRFATDIPNVLSGTTLEASNFSHRYAVHFELAYLHIVPAIVYLLLAPLQLSRRFRSRHMLWHRRAGRVALVAGVIAGALAVVFGLLYPFGGALEASATVIFGAYFLIALALAFRAIRRRETAQHRRWMIRAYAMGIAVGTIRIWVGIFLATGLFRFEDGFGIAFWLSFMLHFAAAELWLRRPGRSIGVLNQTSRANI